jgi:adenine-specific DNA-methyltransferase
VRGSKIVGFGPVAEDDFKPDGPNTLIGNETIAVWPIDSKGVERKWRYSRDSVESIKSKLFVKKVRSGAYDIHLAKTEASYKTVWIDPKYDASSHGTRVVKSFTGVKFPFPKSLYAVEECIASVVSNKPDALVVDFFAGSGTTAHALMLINSRDNGRRRSIIVTNNEVEDSVSKKLARKGIYKGDSSYESKGIFANVTRPRIEAAITGKRPNGQKLSGTYIEGRSYSKGFHENVAFYQLDYLDPDGVTLGQQFDAILPMLWLAAGGIGEPEYGAADGDFSIPEGSTYAILFREERFRAFTAALQDRLDVTHVWLVTDSEAAFAEMRSSLSTDLRVGMLYRDYLRNFRINTR